MKKYIVKIAPFLFFRLAFSGIYSVVTAGIPYIIKLLLDGEFLSVKGIMQLGGLYLGIIATGALCQYISQRAAWRADKNFYILVRRDVFEGILNLNFFEFNQKSTAAYVTTLNNDIEEVQKAMENVLMLIESSLHIIAYGTFLAFLDIRILMVVLFFSSMAIFLPKVTGGELSKRKKERLDKLAEYFARAQDILLAFTNRNKQTKPYIMKHYDKKLIEAEESMEHYGKYKAFSVVLNGTAMYLIGIATFTVVGVLLVLKEITVGTGAAALSYVDQFVFPIKDILNCMAEILSVRGVWDRLEAIIDKKNINEKEMPEKFKNNIILSNVAVKNKDFWLRDISFVFQRNKSYVITGKNGSGKSTILKVLGGRLPYEKGSIKVDHYRLEEIDSSRICEVIEQNQHIYAASVEDNITLFGCYPIERAMEVLGNHPKIQYILRQTNATLLSGGEKQVVIIMKALSSGREILLLDEALSAVDNELSEYIMDRLLELENKTIIAVTHNKSKGHLDKYDFHIEMEDGRIQQVANNIK